MYPPIFVYSICFFLWNACGLGKMKVLEDLHGGNSTRSRTPMSRLRNRQHAEEEDASALKLGTGMALLNSYRSGTDGGG
jgi:hypothetical protein